MRKKLNILQNSSQILCFLYRDFRIVLTIFAVYTPVVNLSKKLQFKFQDDGIKIV